LWLEFLEEVNKTLKSKAYVQVFTNKLVKSPAMEATLHAFKVQEDKAAEKLYLSTSPEFGLKKIWLQGDKDFSKIYEIAPSYRAKEEHTTHHLSEFTMLEYYESSVKAEDFVTEMLEVCKKLLGLSENVKAYSVSLPDLFYRLTGFELKSDVTKLELNHICKSLSINTNTSDTLNDLFQRVYLEVLEPSFSPKDLIVLTDYPPFLSALATINDRGFSERMEIYFSGLELSNAYSELLDADVVKNRWDFENAQRTYENLEPHPIDADLIKALEERKITQGFGVAFGLERLFLLREKLKGNEIDIKHTKF
jgi:lysyl-tRNA synthetase class 2